MSASVLQLSRVLPLPMSKSDFVVGNFVDLVDYKAAAAVG